VLTVHLVEEGQNRSLFGEEGRGTAYWLARLREGAEEGGRDEKGDLSDLMHGALEEGDEDAADGHYASLKDAYRRERDLDAEGGDRGATESRRWVRRLRGERPLAEARLWGRAGGVVHTFNKPRR
jgi:hypothetical protein